LVEALADDYWQVRLRATRSLGRLRYVAPALDALIETLGHRISNLRKEAALALGELNDRGAVAALQAAAGRRRPGSAQSRAHRPESVAMNPVSPSAIRESAGKPCA
jgi:HEAT repeat protein